MKLAYWGKHRMNTSDLIASGVIVGMSSALLWHFTNIWRYGQHLIQEPNTVVLSLETAGLLVILVFGVSKFISVLPRRRRGKELEIKSKRASRYLNSTRKKEVMSM